MQKLSPKDLEPYQRKGANLIARKKKLALFMKPGMGKTVTTLYAMAYLKRHGVFTRCLIVAPKRVCETVWEQEAQQWKGLEHLTFTHLTGTPDRRLVLLHVNTDFHMINFELLDWLNKNTYIMQQYDAIIFDELSKMKTPGSRRFKVIRNKIDYFKISIGLTGTPTGNSLLGLWSQMHCCHGSQNPLSRSHTAYKQDYFYRGGFENRQWFPQENAHERIMAAINGKAFAFELSKAHCPLAFRPIQLTLSKKVKDVYKEMCDTFTTHLKETGEDLFIASKGVLANKLRQLEAGAIYGLEGFELYHTLQLDAAEDLIEELEGDPLLIVYQFQFQKKLLLKRFPKCVTDIYADTIMNWNRGKIPIMAIHPASAGHGLNLQHGGCNMLFLSVPWSYELFDQTIGRLYRKGQKRSVSVYHFQGFTMEDKVFRRLKEHGTLEAKTFKALK